MAVEIKMPDLGTTVEEVTLKREGDFVKRGEPLCEIETDKATTDLESFAQGTLLKRVAAPNTPAPFSPPMEQFYIPDAKRIAHAVRQSIKTPIKK